MHVIIRNSLLFFMLLISSLAYCQQIEKKFIVADAGDSLLLKADDLTFDKQGNFCFNVKNKDKYYFIEKNRKLGPFNFISGVFGNDGELEYTQPDSITHEFYYKNRNGVNIYGPVKGEEKGYSTNNSNEHAAIVTSYNNYYWYYIDSKLIYKSKENPNYSDLDSWCKFSENRNKIYYIRQKGKYYLYVNLKLIDSSVRGFYDLNINSIGNYSYGKSLTYGYSVYPYQDVATLSNTPLKTYFDEQNNYFGYSENYILINGKFYNNIEKITDVIVNGKDKYFFDYHKNDSLYINTNGHYQKCNCDNIYKPVLDENGNYSFYCLHDYYIYVNTNGRLNKKPLSKYGVKAIPVSIDVKGNSFHIFQTDDFTYLYKGDELIYKGNNLKNASPVMISEDFLPTYYKGNNKDDLNKIYLFNGNKTSYIIYNNSISKNLYPLIKARIGVDSLTGSIVTGGINEYGYFLIKNTTSGKYQVIINNRVYKDLNVIDKILDNYWYLDKKELIFFGREKSAFYRYKLSI